MLQDGITHRSRVTVGRGPHGMQLVGKIHFAEREISFISPPPPQTNHSDSPLGLSNPPWNSLIWLHGGNWKGGRGCLCRKYAECGAAKDGAQTWNRSRGAIKCLLLRWIWGSHSRRLLPCSLLQAYWCFGGTYRLHLQGRRVNQEINQQKKDAVYIVTWYSDCRRVLDWWLDLLHGYTTHDYISQIIITHRSVFSVTLLGDGSQHRRFLTFRLRSSRAGACLTTRSTDWHLSWEREVEK
jgi:hypothetical protein